jgi:hypothetical protein
MERRRLLVLGFAVAALLATAAVASSGRPLSASRGAGPTAGFFDYVYTTIVLVAIAIVLVVAWALAMQRPGSVRPRERRWHLLSTLLGIAITGIALSILLHSGLRGRLEKLAGIGHQRSGAAAPVQGRPRAGARDARVRWDEVGVVLVLVAGVVILLAASRGAKRTARPWRLDSQDAVSVALDESLDDLRNDPDLRRAIIAAYARMERTLAAEGVPRRPAEAPFEYVERALGELTTSSDSVRRLTGLFEWAKFSHHEPRPEMRDEAIDALVAVRDELRRPVEAVAV